MQETQIYDPLLDAMEQKQEVFAAEDEAALMAEMNERLEDLEAQGHELVRREPLTVRQAARVANNQAANGDDRLLGKINKLQHHRKGHR